MIKNPFYRAVLAAGYIVAISFFFFFGTRYLRDTPDTILTPITMLSLFVLSASIMGYLFLGAPLQLYLDGDKKGAVVAFAKTVGFFSAITALFLIGLFVSSYLM
ncbi:MAG: hypothetical protein Q7S01_02675 [bacterium]|nr:hypothetical protein [bacterium]